jgi:hypothetical protein
MSSDPRPVNYVESVPVLYNEEYLLDVYSGLGTIEDAARTCYEQVVYSKDIHWEYECEWRIDGGTGEQPNEPLEDNRFNKEELTAVVFGARCSDEVKKRVRAICVNYPNVTFYNAAQSKKNYDLEIIPE